MEEDYCPSQSTQYVSPVKVVSGRNLLHKLVWSDANIKISS
jgi:hypothetical protein